MIGLDTNVIVRYLTQDDAAQSAIANRLFEKELTGDKPGFISCVALVEVVWVLETGYDTGRDDLAQILDRILRSRSLVVESAELVAQALRKYREGSADFADGIIERAGHAAGCSETVTFDKAAARDCGMRLLASGRTRPRQAG